MRPTVLEWTTAAWASGHVLDGCYVVRPEDVFSILDELGMNDNRGIEEIEARWRLREMHEEV